VWGINDLDLADLSLGLTIFKTGPIVTTSLSSTTNIILHGKLEFKIVHFINRDEVVVVAEFFNSWEVSVLLSVLEWQIRIGYFDHKLDALSRDNALTL